MLLEETNISNTNVELQNRLDEMIVKVISNFSR